MVQIGKIVGCGLLEICMGSSHEGDKKCCSCHRKLFEVEEEYHEDSEKYFAIKLCAFISVLWTFSHSFTHSQVSYLFKKNPNQ